MSQPNGNSTEDTDPSDSSAEMSKYGITKKSVDQFYLGEYRYSNLRDAIAQAKRSTDLKATGDAPAT